MPADPDIKAKDKLIGTSRVRRFNASILSHQGSLSHPTRTRFRNPNEGWILPCASFPQHFISFIRSLAKKVSVLSAALQCLPKRKPAPKRLPWGFRPQKNGVNP